MSRPATILREATTLHGGWSCTVVAAMGTAAIYAVATVGHASCRCSDGPHIWFKAVLSAS